MCTAVATLQNCCKNGGDIGPAGAGVARAAAAAAAMATHSFPDRERVGQTAAGVLPPPPPFSSEYSRYTSLPFVLT